jgi:hypothetical protein
MSWGAAPIAGRKRGNAHLSRDDEDMSSSSISKRGLWVEEDPIDDTVGQRGVSDVGMQGGVNNSGFPLGPAASYSVSGAGAAPAPASPSSEWRAVLQNALAAAASAASREAASRAAAEAALADAHARAQDALGRARLESEREAEENRLLKRAVGILNGRLESAAAENAALRAAECGAREALRVERDARLAAEEALRREASARFAAEVHLRKAIDAERE